MIRTAAAFILGAIVGAVAAVFYETVQELTDDRLPNVEWEGW